MFGPTDLRDLFDRAANVPAADRAGFLDDVCGGNAAVRSELERLLAAHDRLGTILDTLPTQDTPDLSRRLSHVRTPALAAGARLGRYEITEALGAGGMGDVYKARDTRLDRIVAVKVLPHDLTLDVTSRQRFEREARAVAALSHPHTCALFDVGRQDDIDYLVMEYIDGETLATRLRRGKLPIDEALMYALHIADALVATHRAGIVHRDLKPGNIMLTPTGAKLLDFGLAKRQHPVFVADGAAGASHLTQTGTILGTVQYMAPEQLEGHDAGERTDIFAFGVVLYEMITGRRAFEGESDAALIGQILHAEPPAPSSIERLTPPALDGLVRACLAKDPSARPQSMSAVHGELLDVRRRASESAGWHRQWLLRIFALAAILAAAASGWGIYRNISRRPSNGSETLIPRSLTPLTFDNVSGFATFSPDGRFVVFSSMGNLWVRATAGGKPVEITHAHSDFMPDWSPDGTSIAFERKEGLFTVSPLGGDERRVAAFSGTNAIAAGTHAPSWSPDGKQILFATEPFSAAIRLFLVAPDQPPRQILADFLQGGDWRLPAWHPDGRITLAGRHRTEGPGIYTVSPEGGRWVKTAVPTHLLDGTKIDPDGIFVLSWAPGGQFLYASCTTTGGIGNIWRFGIDAGLQITTTERMTVGPGSDWWPKISRDGKKLLFTVITGNSRLWSFPFKADKDATVGAPQPISEEDGEVNWASVSRDGRRLAYYYRPLNAPPRQSELRISPPSLAGPPERIPADRYVRMASAWSHRGDRLAIQAVELSTTGAVVANLLIIREQERGSERVVGRCQSASPTAACKLTPVDWTPDDAGILVTSRMGDERLSRLSVWSASVPAPAEAPLETLVADPEWNISQGAYSPDGKWLAFAYGGEYRDEKGIAIVPAATIVQRSSWRSIAEGFEEPGNPQWSPDGRLLYFTSSHGSGWMNVWRVRMTSSTGAQAGVPAVTALPNSSGSFLLNRSYYPRMALGAGRLILPMNSQKATVWMLDSVDR